MPTTAPERPEEASSPVSNSGDYRERSRRHRRLNLLPRISALDWFEVATLAIVTAFVVAQLRPDLLFNSNMDVGGDNAAHVAAASYLVHNLIPKGQLSGWDPQWFGGFPLYVFYFPLPAVITALFSHVTSFAVAFKLVTVLGTVTLPASAYTFGRLAGFRRPTPIVMAAAMLPFLFNWSYTIYGGNIASTLAGEYSFSLACSTGLLFLGCVAYALRTGRLRWLAALLLCTTILCHVVPALFFVGAAVVFALMRKRPIGAIWILVQIGAVGCLLAGFWLFRFGLDLRYSSSMNYARLYGVAQQFFPHGGERAVQIIAAIGFLIACARRNRAAFALGVMSVGAVVAFSKLPSGIVWNPRWIPFFFLSTALLAGYGVSEIGTGICALFKQASLSPWITPPWVTLGTIGTVAAYVGVLPFFTTPSSMLTPLQGWVSWNYSGYQAKSGWPEFKQVILMLDVAGAKYGCGRFDYEYTPNIQNTIGSTIAEMSLPMWTNGCMDSEEGIYFESSTSTPFHFLDQSELSIQASNPVVGLPYQPLNVADGIAHLQMTGTNFFLADSLQVEAAAKTDPSLVEVASTPMNPIEADGATGTSTQRVSWVLYRIRNSAVVSPLTYSPVVESGLSKTAWLALGIRWYQNAADWSVPIAPSGPPEWQRPKIGTLITPTTARPVPHVTISAIHLTASSLSFHVSRTGLPVLVKIPYFPNWQSTGATQPVEVTPNDMVVVPTSRTVTLTYGTSMVDWLGRTGSLVGIGGLVLLWRPTTVPDPTPLVIPGPTPVDNPDERDGAGEGDSEENRSEDAGETAAPGDVNEDDSLTPNAYGDPQHE